MQLGYDLAIVGGGPAGTACALALKDSGLKVALFDKAKFPRDKTCGDAIPGPSIKVIHDLIPDVSNLLPDLPKLHRINSSEIYTPKGRSVKINWKQKAYNMPRLDFDQFLMEQVKQLTNIDIYEAQLIRSIQSNTMLKLDTREKSFDCEMVVGCDGANSVVSRSFGMKFTSDLDKYFGLRAYYENIDSPQETNEFFVLKGLPQAYFWIFPLGNDLFNVGLGFNKKQDQHIDQQKFLSLIRTDPVLSPKFKSAELMSEVIGFRLPLGGEEYKISGERFMLAGDAAYLIDPLQGHGIDKAMISGVLAAAQAEKCIKQNNFSAEFMKTYDREVYKKVGKELKRSLKLMKMLHKNPWMLEQLARMTQNERVKEFLYDKIL